MHSLDLGSSDDDHGSDDHAAHPECIANWPGEFACMDLAGITIPLCCTLAGLICFALFFEHVIHHCIHKAR